MILFVEVRLFLSVVTIRRPDLVALMSLRQLIALVVDVFLMFLRVMFMFCVLVLMFILVCLIRRLLLLVCILMSMIFGVVLVPFLPDAVTLVFLILFVKMLSSSVSVRLGVRVFRLLLRMVATILLMVVVLG